MAKKKTEQPEAALEPEVVDSVEEAELETPENAAEELSEVEKLQQELAQANDKLLRMHAEFDNFRKRSFKDLAHGRTMTQIDTVMPFLQVFDHFSMAMKSAEVSDNIEALKQGLNMILNEYNKAFEELGIVKVNAVGEKFDPNLHDAMANEASDEVPEGTVIQQWSCGYKLGERLLKPARVVVSSGSADK